MRRIRLTSVVSYMAIVPMDDEDLYVVWHLNNQNIKQNGARKRCCDRQNDVIVKNDVIVVMTSDLGVALNDVMHFELRSQPTQPRLIEIEPLIYAKS